MRKVIFLGFAVLQLSLTYRLLSAPLELLGGGGGGNGGKVSTDNTAPTIDDDDDSTKVKVKNSKLRFEFDYLSNATYLGHRGLSPEPEYSPMVRYTTTQKFYYQANFVNALGSSSFYFDELDLTVGKRFQFNSSWDGQLSYAHYFFNSNSERIKAAIQSDLVGGVGYDWDVVETSVAADWGRGNNNFKTKKGVVATQIVNDLTTTFTNNHIFVIENVLHKGNDLTIIPQVDLLVGTQNYMASLRGLLPPPKPSPVIVPKAPILPNNPTPAEPKAYDKALETYKNDLDKYNANQAAIETYNSDVSYNNFVSQFNVTGIILTLSVSYDIGNFSIGVAPYYTFPENLPAGELNNPYFVMAASVYYTFKYPHKVNSAPIIK